MNFNKEEFNKFRERMEEVVKEVEKEFGVEIKFGSISYAENDFTIKTTVFNGSADDKRKNEYLRLCTLYGLEESDLGKEFIFKGKKTWIIGFEASRRKYPVVVKDETGKEFLITIDGVKKCLGKA